MGRISEAYWYANIPADRLSSDGVKSNFYHIEINDEIKAFRKHIQQLKRDYIANNKKSDESAEKLHLEQVRKSLDLQENDLELVSSGKMTIQEFREKWL